MKILLLDNVEKGISGELTIHFHIRQTIQLLKKLYNLDIPVPTALIITSIRRAYKCNMGYKSISSYIHL